MAYAPHVEIQLLTHEKRHEEVLARGEELLREAGARFGPESVPASVGRFYRGEAAISLGRPDEARMWFETALVIQEARLGADHPACATSHAKLALVLMIPEPECLVVTRSGPGYTVWTLELTGEGVSDLRAVGKIDPDEGNHALYGGCRGRSLNHLLATAPTCSRLVSEEVQTATHVASYAVVHGLWDEAEESV